jgi:hypothetical protein
MKIEVTFATEFGSSKNIMKLNELVSFINRGFKILYINKVK